MAAKVSERTRVKHSVVVGSHMFKHTVFLPYWIFVEDMMSFETKDRPSSPRLYLPAYCKVVNALHHVA